MGFICLFYMHRGATFVCRLGSVAAKGLSWQRGVHASEKQADSAGDSGGCIDHLGGIVSIFFSWFEGKCLAVLRPHNAATLWSFYQSILKLQQCHATHCVGESAQSVLLNTHLFVCAHRERIVLSQIFVFTHIWKEVQIHHSTMMKLVNLVNWMNWCIEMLCRMFKVVLITKIMFVADKIANLMSYGALNTSPKFTIFLFR